MMRSIRKWLARGDIRYFKERGYLVFDTGIDERILDGAVADVARFRENPEPQKVSFLDEGRIQDAWRISDNCKRIARDPNILRLLGWLYEREPKPFQTLNFPRGTEQHVHSDSIHFNSEPFGFMCGVWVALEDIGPDQGPLLVYPESQKLPEINFEEVGVEADYKNYPDYERYLDETIVKNALEAKIITMKKGQAVVWAANLLHGGSPQNDKSLTRLSQVTHYYFEGVKPWRPGRSNHSRFYFQPNWIPA